MVERRAQGDAGQRCSQRWKCGAVGRLIGACGGPVAWMPAESALGKEGSGATCRDVHLALEFAVGIVPLIWNMRKVRSVRSE